MPTKAAAALATAAEGLQYQSEMDAPFEPWSLSHAGDLTPGDFRELGGHPAADPVEEVPVDEFFADLTQPADWHGDEEKRAVEGYKRLLAAVRAHLTDPRVYRVGGKHVTIYLAGRAAKTGWAGLKTRALET